MVFYLAFVQNIFWQTADWEVSFDEPRPRHPLCVLDQVEHEEDQSLFKLHSINQLQQFQ